MTQLNFRDALIEDLPAIVAIYNSTVPSRLVTADLEEVSVESRVPWFNSHIPGKRPLFVVENETKEIVGWVSFKSFYGRPAYDATAEISIYLHPDFRGRGLGKKILQQSIEAAKNLGIKTLLGYVFAHNTPSLKMFYDFGFTDWANLPNIAELDGVERSLIIVGKRIN